MYQEKYRVKSVSSLACPITHSVSSIANALIFSLDQTAQFHQGYKTVKNTNVYCIFDIFWSLWLIIAFETSQVQLAIHGTACGWALQVIGFKVFNFAWYLQVFHKILFKLFKECGNHGIIQNCYLLNESKFIQSCKIVVLSQNCNNMTIWYFFIKFSICSFCFHYCYLNLKFSYIWTLKLLSQKQSDHLTYFSWFIAKMLQKTKTKYL